MRLFRASSVLYKQFRKIHSTFLKYVELKTHTQTISYEDLRLQNYLRSLKEQYSDSNVKTSLYDFSSLKNIVELAQEIDVINAELEDLNSFILGKFS